MAAGVNTRECVPPCEDKRSTVQSHKSPRKVRPAGAKARGTEQVEKSGNHAEEHALKTSAFQGKVKALKEKQKKERRKESKVSEGLCSDGDLSEDVLVSPQLRTYLTEDLLDCSKQGTYLGDQQETWSSDGFWGLCNSDGPYVTPSNGCRTVKSSKHSQGKEKKCQENLQASSDEHPCVPKEMDDRDPLSLSLAERVERNRQELRCRFNKAACHGEDTAHGTEHLAKDGSWLFPGDTDGDSGVSTPVTEDCRELSVRHEQAKQLLHRARMKARGASPLRASHCVLPHPNSQPTLHRGHSASGALTDGGSLSDSSSSDYCSWQKSSRGSSPSHVRFQDESERDAEERYRERLQVPQTSPVSVTPPLKRQSNGAVSWTEQLSPSGHGQCGACGSYLKGSGASTATIHGTNLRNVHLGSKITQDGLLSSSLGVKPSPHWILPSQPWRVHTELIRETHIGGDSTADSSGEEDVSRNHNKNGSWGMHKNESSKGTLEHRTSLHPSNSYRETEQNHESTIGTSSSGLKSRVKHKAPRLEHGVAAKLSESNLGAGTVGRGSCVDLVRTDLRKTLQNMDPRPTTKARSLVLETVKDSSLLNTDTVNGSNALSPRERVCMTEPADSKTQVTPVAHGRSNMVPTSDCGTAQGNMPVSGRIPSPPSGKAPITVPLRTGRLTVRSEGTSPQLSNSPVVNAVRICQDKKGTQSDPVPTSKVNSQESLGHLDNHQLPTCGVKARERSQKSKRQTEDRRTKEVKENRNSLGHQVTREQGDSEGPHSSSGQRDYDLHPERSASVPPDKVNSQSGTSKKHVKKDENCTERPNMNGQLEYTSDVSTGSGKCSSENSFICQTSSLVSSNKERCSEPDDRSFQAAMKKDEKRSGIRKILSSIGLTSRPKLERFQSSSLEQLHSAHTSASRDSESFDGSEKPGKMKKSPSLQSLKLMSPFNLPRKASSVQNLLGKSDRSAVYIKGDLNSAPRRALSVEDIGSPAMPRTVGKVAEVFRDGTRLLELRSLEKGGLGFSVSSGCGRPDSGIYVQEMSDDNTAKLYSGLLRVGDEILEVNGTKVSTLGQSHVTEIMNREPVVFLRVLHQRRTKC